MRSYTYVLNLTTLHILRVTVTSPELTTTRPQLTNHRELFSGSPMKRTFNEPIPLHNVQVNVFQNTEILLHYSKYYSFYGGSLVLFLNECSNTWLTGGGHDSTMVAS